MATFLGNLAKSPPTIPKRPQFRGGRGLESHLCWANSRTREPDG